MEEPDIFVNSLADVTKFIADLETTSDIQLYVPLSWMYGKPDCGITTKREDRLKAWDSINGIGSIVCHAPDHQEHILYQITVPRDCIFAYE